MVEVETHWANGMDGTNRTDQFDQDHLCLDLSPHSGEKTQEKHTLPLTWWQSLYNQVKTRQG